MAAPAVDMTEYQEWLKSIEFIDSKGKVLPTELTPDTSTDPEDDREGVE
jgi:hypothetical protein